MKRVVFGVGILCALIGIAGCKTSEQCRAAVSCAKGSYQACSDGSKCRYLTSDQQSFACTNCTDCGAAVDSVNSWCGIGGGGGVMQTQACRDYLGCLAVVDPSMLAAAEMMYGPSGSCWLSATTASVCDSTCNSLLDAQKNIPNAPAACGGTSPIGGSDMAMNPTGGDMAMNPGGGDMAGVRLNCLGIGFCLDTCTSDLQSCFTMCANNATLQSANEFTAAFDCGESYCAPDPASGMTGACVTTPDPTGVGPTLLCDPGESYAMCAVEAPGCSSCLDNAVGMPLFGDGTNPPTGACVDEMAPSCRGGSMCTTQFSACINDP